MFVYFLRRLLYTLFLLWIVSVITFLMMHFLPGDPELKYLLANPHVHFNQEDRARVRQELGLDDPVYVQYMRLMQSFLQGEFGWSQMYKVPMKELLPQRILVTLQMTLPVLFVTVVLGFLLAVICAASHNSLLDKAIRLFVSLGLAIPTFWLGLLGIYLFSVSWAILPAGGISSVGEKSFMDTVRHLVLPVAVLSLHSVGSWTRFIRSSVLDVMRLDYIRMARAHGIPESSILLKHVLRNVLIVVVTLLSLSIPGLFSGALITEEIFSIPGMGQLLYQAILHNDTHVAMVSFLFLSSLTLVSNMLADILYFLVDPRISV